MFRRVIILYVTWSIVTGKPLWDVLYKLLFSLELKPHASFPLFFEYLDFNHAVLSYPHQVFACLHLFQGEFLQPGQTGKALLSFVSETRKHLGFQKGLG
jgi:hypothetical protein